MGRKFKYSFLAMWMVALFGGTPALSLEMACLNALNADTVLIVAPISSAGKQIVDRLKILRPDLVAHYVMSASDVRAGRENKTELGNFIAANFDEKKYEGGGFLYEPEELADLPKILKAKAKRPVLVLAGDESAVELAERIRQEFGLTSVKDPALTLAWFDKGALGDVLSRPELKLSHAKQAHSSDVEALLKWQRDTYQLWPVMVKPSASVATDRTRVCYTEAEVREHVKNSIGQPSARGPLIKEMVIQELLDVRENEFVIDTESAFGQHRVHLSGAYTREYVPGAGFIVTGGKLVDPRGVKAVGAIEYALKVLDAIKYTDGPAHMEIVWTQEGYKIIDFNARGGGTWPQLGFLATGQNFIDWMILGGLAPDEFLRTTPKIPTYRGMAGFFTVRSLRDGSRMANRPKEETFAHVKRVAPSVFELSQVFAPNAVVRKTVDLMSLPIIGSMYNIDPDRYEKDRREVSRLIEENYFVTPP